jgi:hypothetical protein
MYERTYGVTRNAAMGSKNYGGQQQEPPTSNNKNNNWNRNEGQFDERNGKGNVGEQSSKNNQQSNNCSTSTNNNPPQPQEEEQKPKLVKYF